MQMLRINLVFEELIHPLDFIGSSHCHEKLIAISNAADFIFSVHNFSCIPMRKCRCFNSLLICNMVKLGFDLIPGCLIMSYWINS